MNYGLPEMPTLEKLTLLVYYASTSLSTVGFGDFSPVSDSGRIVTVIILLFGVMIFSYLVGEFVNISNSY